MKMIDLHCDTLFRRLEDPSTAVPSLLRKNIWHVDLKKLQKSDSLLQVFAVFAPQHRDYIPDLYTFFLEQHDFFCKEMAQNSPLVSHVTSFDQIETNRRENRISALLSVEESHLLEGDMTRLDRLYEKGVRLMTLLWNHENCLGFPHSPDKEAMSRPLKPFGRDAVLRMEELGILIDVSHLSDGGFADVAALTDKPFLASHSNCRSLAGNSRNLTDEQITLLADRGGVMGLNFYPDFLSQRGDNKSLLSDMVCHIKHMRQVGGIEVIALGSDFDGIEGELEIPHIGEIGRLSEALDKEGFTTGELEKIWSHNALRILKEIIS
ncbi:MAG: membrane dipeptidase [Spirochaetales bacterium]|nr:membrane dipeptidase [Spirochaetales bacterium]